MHARIYSQGVRVCVYGQACAVLPPNMKQGDEGPVCEMSGKGAGRESRVKWLEVNWINTREEQCARNKIKWEIGRKKTKEDKIKNESVCVYKPLYISCQIGRDSTKGHCSMEINFFSLVRGIIFFFRRSMD